MTAPFNSLQKIASLDELRMVYEQACASRGIDTDSEAGKSLEFLMLQLHSQGVHDRSRLADIARLFP
ncbi:hypothetical protein DEM27_22245 [Metarhizobium album]|uniref:Uncharacterized protein n=1 Tax=Metarhizobium album TaxID=2182425 RepID=A0A2U2DL57_9HYPH|nr:hypothetical protein [Rhizobium album]PWE54039.1 hypothetical protein DEM27_22245 [Rhizobium album]